MRIAQECYELCWTSPGCNIPQNSIQIRWARHMGHCWKSKDELISDVLQWTPSHRRARVGWPTRTYLQQLCTDKGCSLEDMPDAMEDRDGWRDSVREIRASGRTLWWLWYIWALKMVFKKNTKCWNVIIVGLFCVFRFTRVCVIIKM